uniref:Piwi domain-containing protein n=1 Tax=Ascaris lumbricoides TaxID=6252 RepID=A0A0M3HSH3_ASCLU
MVAGNRKQLRNWEGVSREEVPTFVVVDPLCIDIQCHHFKAESPTIRNDHVKPIKMQTNEGCFQQYVTVETFIYTAFYEP